MSVFLNFTLLITAKYEEWQHPFSNIVDFIGLFLIELAPDSYSLFSSYGHNF